MHNLPQTVTSPTLTDLDRFNDPIIDREEVMWAARKFILIFGDEAPEAALREVNRLDSAGKLVVAEMFERVRQECARLLKMSEKLRSRQIH
ncbi:MAG: hypothetical protein JKY12_06965 [Sneathiella sp.]|nr:hypothetical protein [Sneathiella sp.]